MALIGFADNVREAFYSVGTTVLLGGAAPNSRPFSEVMANNDTAFIVLRKGNEFSAGLYTYSGGGLFQTTPRYTTNANAAVSFSSGMGEAYIDANAYTMMPLAFADYVAGVISIGANRATNPLLKLDFAASSVVTGLEIAGAAAAGGLALAVTSSGANENLTINARGSGTLGFQNTATGTASFGTDVGIVGALNAAGVINADGAVGIGRAANGASARLGLTEPGAGVIGVDAILSHASYVGVVQHLNVVRAASGSYYFHSAFSGNDADLEFFVRGDGLVAGDQAYQTGADYAEHFEWAAGNPKNEDRRGLSVVLVGPKIRPATQSDKPESIIGVVSGSPSVVGDSAELRWSGKYLRDQFGAYLMEDYEVAEWYETTTAVKEVQRPVMQVVSGEQEVVEIIRGLAVRRLVETTTEIPLFDELPLVDDKGVPIMDAPLVQAMHRVARMVTETVTIESEPFVRSYALDALPEGVRVPKDAKITVQQRRKRSPEYDPTTTYVSRTKRPEWSAIGLMGKLKVRKGQPVGDRWIKMRDMENSIEEWLVR